MVRVFSAVLTILLLALAIGCSNQNTEKKLFDQAKKYQESGDFAKSVEFYEKVVEMYPQGDRSDEAQFMVGYLYANHLNNIPKAKEAYQKYIDMYSATADSGMIMSAKFEMANLGKDIDDIPDLQKFFDKDSTGAKVEKKVEKK